MNGETHSYTMIMSIGGRGGGGEEEKGKDMGSTLLPLTPPNEQMFFLLIEQRMRKQEIFKFVIAAKKVRLIKLPRRRFGGKKCFFLLGKFAKRVREKGMAAN